MSEVARVVLFFVFAVAATLKFREQRRFAATLHLIGIRRRLVPTAALAVPSAEAAVAGLILVQAGWLPVALVALLLAVFSAVTANVIHQRISVSCACFGGASSSVGYETIARNGALLAIAAIAATGHESGLSSFSHLARDPTLAVAIVATMTLVPFLVEGGTSAWVAGGLLADREVVLQSRLVRASGD